MRDYLDPDHWVNGGEKESFCPDAIPLTDDEEACWYEAGLQCHGVQLGKWEQEAIIRYGRLLIEKQNERVRSVAP